MRPHARRLLLLIVLALPITLLSQTKPRRLGIAITPVLEYSSLPKSTFPPFRATAFGLGLQLCPTWRLGQHFSLQLGLGIHRYRYKDQITGVWSQQYDGFGDPDPHYGHTVQYKLSFTLLQAQVPLTVRYHFQDPDKGFFVGVGPEFNAVQIWNLGAQMVDQGIVFEEDGEQRSSILPLLAGRLCLGYALPIGDRLLLIIETYGRVGTSLSHDAKFTAKTAGLRIGIAF